VAQHRRGIDILPPPIADIDCAHLVLRRHQPNAIGQAAVAPAAAGFRALEIVENFLRTNKETCINRVVFRQVFSNRGDPIPMRLHFHRIRKVKNRIQLLVDCQVKAIEVR